MADVKTSWGSVSNPSSIEAQYNNQCIDFTYTNTLTDSLAYQPLVVDGNVAQVDFGDGNIPDIFSVVPAPGWEVFTQNSLSVEEFTSVVVTVCQMLLG